MKSVIDRLKQLEEIYANKRPCITAHMKNGSTVMITPAQAIELVSAEPVKASHFDADARHRLGLFIDLLNDLTGGTDETDR